MANVLNVSGGGKAPVIQSKSVKSTTSQQTVTAPSGVDGYNPITVEPIKLQVKTVVPKRTNEQTVVTADSRYDGLSQVAVEGVPIQSNKYVYPPFATEVFYPDTEYYGIYAVGVYGCKAIIFSDVSVDSNGKLRTACGSASRVYAVHIVIPYTGLAVNPPGETIISEAAYSAFSVSGQMFCSRVNADGSSGTSYNVSGLNISIENNFLVIAPEDSSVKFFENIPYTVFAIVA